MNSFSRIQGFYAARASISGILSTAGVAPCRSSANSGANLIRLKENVGPLYSMSFRSLIHTDGANFDTSKTSTERPDAQRPGKFDVGSIFAQHRRKNLDTGNSFTQSPFSNRDTLRDSKETSKDNFGMSTKSMDFVRNIIDESTKDSWGGSQSTRHSIQTNADVVHIKLIRNNSFVTLTDSKGNTKATASSGSLKGSKGVAKVSRYSAEATSEHVGRVARNLGVKSVVVKVSGFIYFKKKRQAIQSFKEGFTNSRNDQNPIVYLEDTTRRPHNGCRRRKQRRV